ncbi:protein of unknown function [Maridesulfovibrio hydrothermalis AM13 = DSM 14728]|uniref:Uncharacterized protein n=1 Tax=Maridesulfovibrio hydrothermalis AM13 = DSM 14728 TaxID=1121451 RepID=L0R8T4_9BACT|nr:protein of unknown function [Maridesulfovibrio hydrothermalis AM13 = DSM 14728]
MGTLNYWTYLNIRGVDLLPVTKVRTYFQPLYFGSQKNCSALLQSVSEFDKKIESLAVEKV